MEKKYWKGVEELRNDAEFVKAKQSEFAEFLPIEALGGKSSAEGDGTSRRDFLKYLGFGVAAASLASCEAPVKKTIPYLIKPEEITPGVANWYATTFADGMDYASILVKTREGRPIKIEGNKLSSISNGAVDARVHASVLSLYDSTRLQSPLAGHSPTKWATVDKEIMSKLEAVATNKGQIRIMTSTIVSPSIKAAIGQFVAKYPTAKVVTYDPISYSAITTANQDCFGKAVVPSYRFDNAYAVVSFGADFLASWLSPLEHAKQYVKNRKLNGKKSLSKHIQFETNLSLTGSNADVRVPVKPSEQAIAVVHLHNKIAALAGQSTLSIPALDAKIMEAVDKAAKELWSNKGKALVVAGDNDVNIQSVVNAINSMLDSYGNTIDLDNYSNLRQSNDGDLVMLLDEMKKGEVGALFVYNANPAYTLPSPDDFKAALSKVGLKVSLSDKEDETAILCDYVCPDSHYLESWGDAEPKKGTFSLMQPTIAPLFDSRQALVSFVKWSGVDTDANTFVANYWRDNVYKLQSSVSIFEAFWNKSLQDGVFEVPSASAQSYKSSKDLSSAASAIGKLKNDTLEIALYVKAGAGDGKQANNPWLQELPDPISKVCWDNYITISPRFAADKGLKQQDVAEITVNGKKYELPVLVQPGQAYNSIGVAVGYGRTSAGKVANNLGVNAYPMAAIANGNIKYSATGVAISKSSKPSYTLAATQTHHTMMGRAIVKETTLNEWHKDPKAGNAAVLIQSFDGKKAPKDVNFWEAQDKPNHAWGLAIDLNSCIGCGACVVSCQAENNVPVVGKDEVNRSREMHWIRIDRYYSSDEEQSKSEHKDLSKMEVPSGDNPQVVFQPVMCQHCNHAPCETVCPVAATTHSSEGMNQMAYNRCVGTRYCANNCPYKVRRFNWFKYSDNKQFDFNMNDDLGKMVLNPDVVVRSRGVMEKCSMCVQRVQAGKLDAKKENRTIKDGEIQTACTQSCPTEAIVFGDMNDADSRISQMFRDERSYHLLEELDVQPSVFYQTKVRNA